MLQASPSPRSVLLLLALVASPLSAQEAPPSAALGQPVTAPFLSEFVHHFAGDAFRGRDTPSPELDRAAKELAQRFKALGLKPAFGEDFLQEGPVRPRRPRRAAPAEEGATPEGKANNVGALIPGADPLLKDELIVFSAHYDHVGAREVPEGQDGIYNGADDDATGVAAVMALAKAWKEAKTPPKRSLLFLCFYGEEKGMLGSRHYVAHPIRHLHQHVAVFNLEMLGRPDDIEAGTGWITGHRVSDFGDMVATGAKAVGVRLGEHPRFSRMLFAASDNISFAKEGVIAHSISAGSLHDDYHKPTDEPGKIDYEHMARVVNGLLHGSHALAMGGARPRWKEDTSYAEKAKALAVSFAAQETAEPKR